MDHNPHEKDFLNRMYSGDMERYQRRVKSVGFTNKKRVLDAGCGFGQWSIALSMVNEKVYAADINLGRLEEMKEIVENRNINNISFSHCSIDSLPFRSNTFDAIFCYSVIYFTDYKKTIEEFYRVLKLGGNLYFVTNGIGWYLHNIINNRHPSKNYNPRIYAVKTILDTILYSIIKNYRPKVSIVMSPRKTVKYLRKIGYRDILTGGEGCVSVNPNIKTVPFYPMKHLNIPNVFEVHAKR